MISILLSTSISTYVYVYIHIDFYFYTNTEKERKRGRRREREGKMGQEELAPVIMEAEKSWDPPLQAGGLGMLGVRFSYNPSA